MSKFLPLEAAQLAVSLFSSAYNEEQRVAADVGFICGDRPHAAPALLRDQAEGPVPKI